MKRLQDEEGMTIIEVLMAVVLMLVVVFVAVSGLVNLSRSSASAQLRTFSMQQNRVGLERLSYLLRQGTYAQGVSTEQRNVNPIITSAGSNQVTFTSRGGGSSSVQQYTAAISGGNLTVGKSTSCSGSPCTTWSAPTQRTLVTGVQNSATGPCAAKNADGVTFRYYSSDSGQGALVEIPLTTDPLTANGTLAQIDTVQITLWTQESGGGVSKTCEPLQARVNIRNLTFQ
jgi:type II secretory pathway component PulJ